MSSSLAMPGPLPAAWMSALGRSKDSIRATILMLFIFSYGAAIALQALVAGVSVDTLTLTGTLVPATLVGVFCGRILADRISERAFRLVIVVVLAATSTGLLANAAYGLLTNP